MLIANEIVDSTLRRKKCELVCKLDIEKTYDNLNWEFLYQVIGMMGFDNWWMSWIKWCISTASFSVLITVCTDKRKGGLGIKSFSKMNKALLCKWSWGFANNINSLWRKVICSKFGETNGGWHTCDLRGGYGISLWKEIGKEWPNFSHNTVFSLGDGRRINFWKDVWCR